MKNYNFNRVWSKNLNDLVVREFFYRGDKYIWNEDDCVYYHEDTNEKYFMEMPKNAIYN